MLLSLPRTARSGSGRASWVVCSVDSGHRAAQYQPAWPGNRVLATAQLSFLVPEVLPDRKIDPFDVGNLEVRIAQRLRVGDMAPPIQLETLDGKTMLKLEDYPGQVCPVAILGNVVRSMSRTDCVSQAGRGGLRQRQTVCHRGCEWDHETSDAIAFVGKHRIPWVQGYLGDTQSPKSPGAKIIKDYSVGLPQIWLIGPDGRIVAPRPLSPLPVASHDSAVRPD